MELKVLLACEESQTVTKAFRDLGHLAFSCDIQDCSGLYPEYHIKGDALELLKYEWDLIIAFPPCTYMSNVGAVRMFPKKGQICWDRYEKGVQARKFFESFYKSPHTHIAIENPVPMRCIGLPAYSQIIQPYMFGDPYTKKTCLWLKNLPKLESTDLITEGLTGWVSGGSKDHKGEPRRAPTTTLRDAKSRSKTFPGIAKAMAEQWSEYIIKNRA